MYLNFERRHGESFWVECDMTFDTREEAEQFAIDLNFCCYDNKTVYVGFFRRNWLALFHWLGSRCNRIAGLAVPYPHDVVI